MRALSALDPVGRFTGLAEIYARYRPGYPQEAVDCILARCGLGNQSVLVDVGCGTGISSRQFAARGVSVIGIEPNSAMRAAAQGFGEDATEPRVIYREGRAEATDLAAGNADALLAAQSFHWFEPEATLREFHRILKSGGWVVLMWNEWDTNDQFTAAYGTLISAARKDAGIDDAREPLASDALQSTPLFRAIERAAFFNQQLLDLDCLLGRAFSVSFAPRMPVERAAWTEDLTELFRRHRRDERVVLRYRTSVYMSRRCDDAVVIPELQRAVPEHGVFT
jgi:SAM-dependent methyltransferase